MSKKDRFLLFFPLFYVFSQPPFPFFFLSYFCLIPLFCAIEEIPKKDFLRGLLSGFFAYLGLVYWVVIAMKRYGGINLIISLLILTLFCLYLSSYYGLFCAILSLLKKKLRIPFYLSAPPLFVLLEYLRGILFTGFPWGFLAHSHYSFLPLIECVSITGSYFISFLIVLLNILFFYLLKKEHPPFILLFSVIVIYSACLFYGIKRLGEEAPSNVKVAIIQGNIRQDMKWGKERRQKILERYKNLSLKAGNVDLVLWPETAMPFIFEEEREKEEIKRIPVQLKNYLLFGSFSREEERIYNASFMIDPKGEVIGTYRKVHLVPFGEYTPLLRYMPFKEWIKRHVGEISSGKGHFPIKTDMGNLGVLICYEGIFPYISRESVKNGAQVLVNLTNDAWYDRSSAPYQHFAFYIFRAIETDRFVLRAANTGISTIIDPFGRIKGRTNLFQEEILLGSFSFRDSKTFYVKYGDYFILLCLLFLFIILSRYIYLYKLGISKYNIMLRKM